MRPPDPVLTTDLFPEERAALVDLLRSLSDREWQLPSACPGWSVKDLAAHIAGDDLASIARQRDGHFYAAFGDAEPSWDELVAFINRQNDEWVVAMRRLSPRQVIELLEASGPPLFDHWRSLDPMLAGGAVSWAGPEPAPVWFDVAREYTERWAHQQQIRDGLGRPGLTDRHFMGPVLDTYVRALPYTFRDAPAAHGAHVRLEITDDAGGDWSLICEGDAWRLYVDVHDQADAAVKLDQDTAWRLFTKALTPAEARPRATMAGDAALASVVLRMVSVIA